MRLMTSVLLGIVTTGIVVAVAMTGTVYASRSLKPAEGAAISTKVTAPVTPRVETRPITFAEVLPAAAASEMGYFIGTGDGNGIWIQR